MRKLGKCNSLLFLVLLLCWKKNISSWYMELVKFLLLHCPCNNVGLLVSQESPCIPWYVFCLPILVPH